MSESVEIVDVIDDILRSKMLTIAHKIGLWTNVTPVDKENKTEKWKEYWYSVNLNGLKIELGPIDSSPNPDHFQLRFAGKETAGLNGEVITLAAVDVDVESLRTLISDIADKIT